MSSSANNRCHYQDIGLLFYFNRYLIYAIGAENQRRLQCDERLLSRREGFITSGIYVTSEDFKAMRSFITDITTRAIGGRDIYNLLPSADRLEIQTKEMYANYDLQQLWLPHVAILAE